MRWTLLLLFALTPACDSSGPCQPRHGLYQQHYEASGPTTCPPLPDTVINADAPSTGTSNCQGGTTFSDDMCHAALDLNCPSADGSSRVISRGSVDWDEDGASASGTMYFEVRSANNGPLLCAGTYRVTFKRL